ncbi:tyrosine-type recombinase/integrase [Nostocoides japonicum]|nr:tyrosine-type recombinase/integrase [Tetrasphaera japonica]
MREWVTWLQASGTPTTTIGLRRYYVVRLIRHFPNRELRTLTTSDLLAWLAAQNWSPNTRKAARSALRNFYGWLAHTERIPRSPALELPVIRVPRARPKPTPEDVYREALATDDARARLAIRLAGQCGLRRGEICKVRGDDIAQTPSGPSLRVVGKGGHARDVPLPEDLAEEITEHGPGWLFPSPSARGGHLTPHHLAKIVTAALGGEACTHSLRHRAATMAYAGTRDLRAVQELLGHSRPETTAGYVLAPDDTIRAAMMAAAR